MSDDQNYGRNYKESTNCETGCATCNGTTCTKCKPEFYLTNGNCGQCTTNCRVCVNGNSCRTCSEGFYLSNGRCEKCAFGCAVCNNAQTCLTCGKGFHTITNRAGYCARCTEGCSTCRNEKFCTSCNDEYSLDKDDGECEKDGWSWWWLLLLIPLLLLCCLPLLLLGLCRGGKKEEPRYEMNPTYVQPQTTTYY